MRRTVALALSAVLMVGLFSAQPASAVDPTGTITLASGDSPFSGQLEVLGGSVQGVVFADSNPATTVWVRHPDGHLTTFASAGLTIDVTGDLVVGWNNGTGAITYQSIDGSIQGSSTYDVTTQRVVGATATGWVLQNMDADENPTTLVHVLAATKVATTLAEPAGGNPSIVGPAGVVFGDTGTISYTSLASPGTSTAIGSCGGECALTDIDGSAVLWLDDGDSRVVRQPLNGSLATRIALPVGATANNAGASMTDTRIALGDCNAPSSLSTVPLAGGAWTKLTGAMAGLFSCWPASDGAQFLLSTTSGATPAQAGIYRLSSAATPPTFLVAVSAKPLQGKAIAVGAGRATWVDDAHTDKPVWNRSLSGSGSTMTAGSQSVVTNHATAFGLSVSGRRTVFTHENGTVGLVTGSAAATTIDDTPELSPNPAQLSGTRLLTRLSRETWRLHDLVSGTSTDLVSSGDNRPDAALWGDTVAFSEEQPPGRSGTVSIRSIPSGATTTVAGPTPLYNDEDLSPTHPSGIMVMGDHVSVWGDYVAWDETTVTLVDPGCDPNVAAFCATTEQTVVKYRNFRTMGTVKSLPVNGLIDLTVTSSRVILVTQQPAPVGSGMLLTLRGASLGSEATTQLAQLPFLWCCNGSRSRRLSVGFSIDGTTVGWLGEDERPKVLSWGTDPAQPRFLGNPIAPTTFDPATTAWNAEWVFSKPLPTCTVSIRDGATVVRSLGCATTDGSAVVAWDGKDGLGNPVPEGTYTWTVNAADATGDASNVDGGSSAITGSVHLAAGPVATTLTSHTSTSSVTYGGGVTLSGVLKQASGNPVNNAAVAVQTRASGATAWTALSTVHTSVSGGWTIIAKPGINRSYRAVYAGDAGDRASTSAIVTVTVRPTITLKLSKKKVQLGAKVKFKGSVAPQHKGQRVSLQRWQGGKWVTKTTAKLGSTSKFKIVWTTTSKKDFSWRVLLPTHSDHAAGVSPSRKLKVV